MSAVDQLLAKALSTTSEDEAVACLRMARKKGGKLSGGDESTSEYNGHSAQYWYDKAFALYTESKKMHTQDDMRKVYEQYHHVSIQNSNLRSKNYDLDRQISKLQVKLSSAKQSLLACCLGVAAVVSVVAVDSMLCSAYKTQHTTGEYDGLEFVHRRRA